MDGYGSIKVAEEDGILEENEFIRAMVTITRVREELITAVGVVGIYSKVPPVETTAPRLF